MNQNAHRLERRQYPMDKQLLADLPPLLRRIFLSRGITHTDQVDYRLQRLVAADQLKDIDRACQRLTEALQQHQSILIVGDFDADGATSTALAIKGLKAMGATQVNYLVPNRFDFGYGLSAELVDVAIENGKPDLIITVDNGISSIAGVAHATAHGIDVLVTDHHLPGATLPQAVAIVNPNQPDDHSNCGALAGVGVVFYLLVALRQHLRNIGWFHQRGLSEPNLAVFLDLVALGTVADVVPLDDNNRIIVSQGLRRIRAGQATPGIQALLKSAGRDPQRIQASDLGFAVGPRLNAAGRLEDMSLGIECLLTSDLVLATEFARQLDTLNQQRRQIETSMQAQAKAIVESMALDSSRLPWGLCFYQPDWHQGVVGLVASRMKERLHRPVIAFAEADETSLKGSGRSIPGLHIRDALERVATRHPKMIDKFGGHAMAAGLALQKQQLDAFSKAFDQAVRELLTPEQLQPVAYTDGPLEAEDFSLETAQLLRQSGPWGQAFPEPVFDGKFLIVSKRLLKEIHLKLELRHGNSSQTLGAIAFNINPTEWPEAGEYVHLVYNLDINRWQNQDNLQLMVQQKL